MLRYTLIITTCPSWPQGFKAVWFNSWAIAGEDRWWWFLWLGLWLQRVNLRVGALDHETSERPRKARNPFAPFVSFVVQTLYHPNLLLKKQHTQNVSWEAVSELVLRLAYQLEAINSQLSFSPTTMFPRFSWLGDKSIFQTRYITQ